MTPNSRGRTIAAMGTAAATAAALAAGALVIAARRGGVSRRGWLVTNLVVPALYGKRGGGLDRFFKRIAQDRANGPAAPSTRVQSRYDISDTRVGGSRAFRLRRRDRLAPAARVLYLHGGAYVFDLMASQWPIATGLADRCDAEVVVALYPLAPEHRVEAGLDAIEAVYRALADEVGSTNVVVVGDSAGGGLALALAHRSRDVGLPPPGALVLYFPWLDVGVTGADQPRLETIDPALSIDQLREAGRLWSGGDPADRRASPLFADHEELPPTLVLVGTKDLLLSDSRRFAGRHRSAIVREYPGMFHGFVCAPIPEAHRALDESAEFIRRHLGRSH